MPTAGVIFDLLSLVDLHDLLERAQRHAAESTHVRWNPELARALAGMPLSAMASIIATRGRGVTGHLIGDLDDELRTRLDTLLETEDLKPQGDVLDLLAKLEQEGRPVGVVSTLPPSRTERCLEATNTRSLVGASTGDHGIVMPGSTGPLLYLAGELLLEPTHSVVITHTAVGIATARAARFFVVTDPTVDHDVRADAHLASYRDVHVDRLFARAKGRQPA